MSETTCYKCDSKIKVADANLVHPLCENCETSFDKWFEEQLQSLGGQ